MQAFVFPTGSTEVAALFDHGFAGGFDDAAADGEVFVGQEGVFHALEVAI